MSRPILQPPYEPFDRLIDRLAFLGLVLLITLPMLAFEQLPAVIPIHFGLDGRPDGYGPRSTIFLLPFLGLCLHIFLTTVSHFPHKFNYPVEITEENAAAQYRNAVRMMRVLRAVILLTFAFITYGIIQTALGQWEGLGKYFLPTFLSVLLGSMGYFSWRAYQV